MNRPSPNEYNPYFQNYIDLAPDGSFIEILHQNTTKIIECFEAIAADRHHFRYANGKWTIKELFMHMIDVERVMQYRAFVASRHDDKTPLYPINDQHYVQYSNVENKSMEDLITLFKTVRQLSVFSFTNLTEDQYTFMADGVSYPITARALGYIIIGHSIHHLHILRSRYLAIA